MVFQHIDSLQMTEFQAEIHLRDDKLLSYVKKLTTIQRSSDKYT